MFFRHSIFPVLSLLFSPLCIMQSDNLPLPLEDKDELLKVDQQLQYTPLHDVCKVDPRELSHWRFNQLASLKTTDTEWRRRGEEALQCKPTENYDNELGVFITLVEGAVCDGSFTPLRRPRLFNFPSRVWEIRCFPDFTGEKISNIEFRHGLMIYTGEKGGYVGFPVIPSTTARRVDLRHRRPRVPHDNPYQYQYAAVAASPITCDLDIKFVALPTLNYTGQTMIFKAFEADSRNCGYSKSDGYDAVAILPFPIRNNPAKNLHLMVREMKRTLSPFASSFRFFTSNLRYHGIRALIIEANYLLDELTDSSLMMERVQQTKNITVLFHKDTYSLLSSLFMQGIIVCIAVFDESVQTSITRPKLVDIENVRIFLAPGSPEPSPMYQAITSGIMGPFIGDLLEKERSTSVASLSGERVTYRTASFVSLIVDGITSQQSIDSTDDLPVYQLKTYWREIAGIHKNVQPEDVDRGLEENEIGILTTKSRALLRCQQCVILQSTAKTMQLDRLTITQGVDTKIH